MTSAVAARTPAYRGKLDQICADAVDVARAAVTEDVAGAHIEVVAEGERLVTHYFECMMAGYRGWRWAVTVARTSRSKQVTICETVLLPGPDALTTPDWVPWNERVKPGDLGVGDLMPTSSDDDRLVPGYLLSGDPAVDDVVWEIGLGRVRVLSREGRLDAADRWHAGEAGPQAAIATSAPANARCVSCGFFLPLAGAMSGLFGACANVYAPDDGRVVANDHGCGAHSEVLIEQVVEVDEAPTIYDDAEVEPVTGLAEPTEDLTELAAELAGSVAELAGSVLDRSTVAESVVVESIAVEPIAVPEDAIIADSVPEIVPATESADEPVEAVVVEPEAATAETVMVEPGSDAVEPGFVAVAPEAAVVEPEAAAIEAAAIEAEAVEPGAAGIEAAAIEAEAVEPEAAAIEAEHVAAEPEAAAIQPDSVVSEAVATEPVPAETAESEPTDQPGLFEATDLTEQTGHNTDER